jgi:hypothetical protein
MRMALLCTSLPHWRRQHLNRMEKIVGRSGFSALAGIKIDARI